MENLFYPGDMTKQGRRSFEANWQKNKKGGRRAVSSKNDFSLSFPSHQHSLSAEIEARLLLPSLRHARVEAFWCRGEFAAAGVVWPP